MMHDRFTPVHWAHHTNIYEVNIRQYTAEGTLNAFARHLPRLKDMGVETLWFMPLQPIGILNRKGTLGSYYSISDYASLNPEYGTFEDFRVLVNEAHGYDMKVIIDWVANHTAWDHVWTVTHPDFFSKNEIGHFRPPYPDWADVIHLNYGNQALWSAMIADMRFWVNEFDIDGFRCDMAHLVPLEFWKWARRELDTEKKLFWLAETEEAHYHEAFDASYTWEFLHTMEAYWRRETNIRGLDAILQRYDQVFPADAIRMFFTSNHDENSHSGSEYERMGHAAKAFAVFCATWKGIPLIYSGQELPNPRRLKFFEKDIIEWTVDFGMHEFYKTLLHLRRNHPALRAGDIEVKTNRVPTSDNEHLFCYMRENGERQLLVILNLSFIDDLHFEIKSQEVSGIYKNIFTSKSADLNSTKHLAINAWDYLVFEK